MHLRLALCGVLLVATLHAGDDFTASLETWRSARVQTLTKPDGWLTLIGLHWLQPGANTIGHAAGNSLPLAAGPAYLGTVTLTPEGRVIFAVAAGATATMDGQPVQTAELHYKDGKPTIVHTGTVSFFAIQRGEKIGLRVRDSESPRRQHFAGIDSFPADPAWRIEARWVPFDTPRLIPITNVLGQTSPLPAPGKAVFSHDGKTYELIPIVEGSEELFFIIADQTSGEETYGASRFLYAAPPQDGKVILDFNRAQNPPCAFTPFATCPLPPKENRLPFRVTAGEKNYRGEPH